ncbi:hypothetical protein CPLU01_05070 [Colletotrichum plurivorum]|uniref:Uncharacterized protein n=1 Tax=Colletotrichum plurivorum TaxID=2175906 RepID=A0A8H6NI40_9PEZI|nr:hypothetical protein CPLU01_05070 [Colletotrichum plurivorum]
MATGRGGGKERVEGRLGRIEGQASNSESKSPVDEREERALLQRRAWCIFGPMDARGVGSIDVGGSCFCSCGFYGGGGGGLPRQLRLAYPTRGHEARGWSRRAWSFRGFGV